MDIAHAAQGAGGGLGAFIPLLILGIIPAFLFKSIARRKGRSQWLWFLAGYVPVWGWLAGIWLASLPDKSFKEDVHALLAELQKFDFVSKPDQPIGQSSFPQAWKCNCGRTNNIDDANCPQCGLKRDYLLKNKN